jgi:hypothetical protein
VAGEGVSPPAGRGGEEEGEVDGVGRTGFGAVVAGREGVGGVRGRFPTTNNDFGRFCRAVPPRPPFNRRTFFARGGNFRRFRRKFQSAGHEPLLAADDPGLLPFMGRRVYPHKIARSRRVWQTGRRGTWGRGVGTVFRWLSLQSRSPRFRPSNQTCFYWPGTRSSTSAFSSSYLTSISFVVFPAPWWTNSRVYLPGGNPEILNRPFASVTAKNGLSTTFT